MFKLRLYTCQKLIALQGATLIQVIIIVDERQDLVDSPVRQLTPTCSC